MPNFYCNAPGCNASTLKQKNLTKYPQLAGVTFHPFPDARKHLQLRRKWIQLLRREASWQPNKFSRVCSLHFVGGKGPTDDHPLPTLFAYNNFKRTEDSKLRDTTTSSLTSTEVCLEPVTKKRRRSKEKIDTKVVPSRFTVEPLNDIKLGGQVFIGSKLPNQEDLLGGMDFFHITPYPSICHNYPQSADHQTWSSTSDACTQTDLTMDDMANTLSNAEINAFVVESSKNEKQIRRNLNVKTILKNDTSVKKYTGFQSKSWLMEIFSVIDSTSDSICYWKGKKRTNDRDNYHKKRGGQKRALTRFQEYLFTLVRLRTGLLLWILGDIFGISASHGSEIFTSWLNILFNVFKPLILFPSRTQVDAHMPMSFRKKYPKTRIVIDCTEFFFQRPRATKAQAAMWSSYKSRNTGKVLIGITPAGLISFVSRVYGGNSSDRYISQHSGILDLIEEGDDVMADRGFTIRDLLTLRKATLNIPPFTHKLKSGKRILTLKEIKQTRDIASVRIHVERAIQRLKTFKLLSGTIPLVLKDKLYPMIIVAAFLCNLHPKLVKK